jgi:hypothetical protein
MKKSILAFFVFAIIYRMGAQQPSLVGYTVFPQQITPSSFIKIAWEVATPNQGIVVDQSLTINPATKEIFLSGCYWNGMLPATQTFIDTFMVGALPAGNYLIHRKAYMSSTQQHCSKIDSNQVTNLFAIQPPPGTFIAEQDPGDLVTVFPNPSTHVLYCKNVLGNVQVYSAGGALIKETRPANDGAVDIDDLPAGLYFIRFTHAGSKKVSTLKLIKPGGE